MTKMPKTGFPCTRHHTVLWTLGACCIASTQCIMTPVTFFCMLTLAPRSNSIFTHVTSRFCEATINAVHPSCNDKHMYSCLYHQCQIHIQLMNSQSKQGPPPYTAQQHILLKKANSSLRGMVIYASSTDNHTTVFCTQVEGREVLGLKIE